MTNFRDRFPRNPHLPPPPPPPLLTLDPQHKVLLESLNAHLGLSLSEHINIAVGFYLDQLRAQASIMPHVTLLARIMIGQGKFGPHATTNEDGFPGGPSEGEPEAPPEKPEQGEDPEVFRKRLQAEAGIHTVPKGVVGNMPNE